MILSSATRTTHRRRVDSLAADSLLQAVESAGEEVDLSEIGTTAEGRTRTRRRKRAEEDLGGSATSALTQPRRLHRYRRSPRFACHFDGLAAVEVHSIMQMLDRRSLLQLARCSRRMHADANSDAAWSAQPTFEILLYVKDRDIGPRMQQSLLRHLPRVEVWTYRRETNPPVDVQAMLSIPRITGIVGCQCGLPAKEWLQILSHPCTAGLTYLSISDASLLGALPAELTAQLARLARLDTLVVGAACRVASCL